MGGTVASAGLGGLLAAQLGTTAVEPAVLAQALRATFLAAVTIVTLGMLATLWLRDLPLGAR